MGGADRHVGDAVARRRGGWRRIHTRLNRVASFLTWQGAALVVAAASAAVTRLAAERGVERIKLAGYLPLAASVFIVGALVVMIAFRVLVQPAFA